jgi:hypothetical protein
MKTTIDLPDSLTLRLKLAAVRRGKIIKSLATESIRMAMQAAAPASARRETITLPLSPSAPPVVRHRVKLPLIVAPPGSPTFSLTGEDIDRLLMEDEVKRHHDAAGH